MCEASPAPSSGDQGCAGQRGGGIRLRLSGSPDQPRPAQPSPSPPPPSPSPGLCTARLLQLRSLHLVDFSQLHQLTPHLCFACRDRGGTGGRRVGDWTQLSPGNQRHGTHREFHCFLAGRGHQPPSPEARDRSHLLKLAAGMRPTFGIVRQVAQARQQHAARAAVHQCSARGAALTTPARHGRVPRPALHADRFA